MRATGPMIKPTGRVDTLTLMEQSTLANGKTISSMGAEFNNGLMEKNTKGNIRMGLKRGKECSNFLMVAIIRVNFSTTKYTGKVNYIFYIGEYVWCENRKY